MSTPGSTPAEGDWFGAILTRMAFDARISASAMRVYAALPVYGAVGAAVPLSPTHLGRELHMGRATVRTALSQLTRAAYVDTGRRGARLVYRVRNGVRP